MEIQTRLKILNQHLDLLIEATEQCDTLKGENIASTLYLIQIQIQEIQQQIQTSP